MGAVEMGAKAPNQGTLEARRSQPTSPLWCVAQGTLPIKAAIDASGIGRDRAPHQA
jgi:hypothetical protein